MFSTDSLIIVSQTHNDDSITLFMITNTFYKGVLLKLISVMDGKQYN